MEDAGVIIAIILVLIYLPVGGFVYIQYLSNKQRFSRFVRIISVSVAFLFIPFLILLVTFKFTGLTWKGFGIGVLGLVLLNLLFIFGQHLSESYFGWRIARKRKKLD